MVAARYDSIPHPAVTVYAASSEQIPQTYFEAAQQLGTILVQRGAAVIDGGGRRGLMGAINNAALAAGGSVIGVIPRFMEQRGWQHPGLSRIIVTEDMHTRKATMAELSDAAIALPGGVGTFEELLEIITWRKLSLYSGPVVIFNVDGYYDDLLAMLSCAERQGFLNTYSDKKLYRVATTAEEAADIALGVVSF